MVVQNNTDEVNYSEINNTEIHHTEINSNIKSRLHLARQHIANSDYDKARSILSEMSNPKAQEWLEVLSSPKYNNSHDNDNNSNRYNSKHNNSKQNSVTEQPKSLNKIIMILVSIVIILVSIISVILVRSHATQDDLSVLEAHIDTICREDQTTGYKACFAEMQDGFSMVAKVIADFVISVNPDITQLEIESAVVTCSNLMVHMDDRWVWGSDTYAMCGDLYFKDNISLISQTSERCYGRDITLRRVATDDEHDRCVREIISMRVFVDYYPEDDDGLNITAPEFVGK